MTDSVKQFVLPLIEKNTRLPKGVDIDSFNYIDSEHIDSIGIIKFVVEIESHFGVDVYRPT